MSVGKVKWSTKRIIVTASCWRCFKSRIPADKVDTRLRVVDVTICFHSFCNLNQLRGENNLPKLQPGTANLITSPAAMLHISSRTTRQLTWIHPLWRFMLFIRKLFNFFLINIIILSKLVKLENSIKILTWVSNSSYFIEVDMLLWNKSNCFKL